MRSASLRPAPNPGNALPRAQSRAIAAALIGVPSEELLRGRLDVAETGQVDAVRPLADRGSILETAHHTGRTGAHPVVHQVPAEHAAGVGQPRRPLFVARVQQDARGLQGRGTKEDHPRLELQRLARPGIDDTNPPGPPGTPVMDDAVHDAVRPQGQSAGAGRRRQGHVHAVEVGERRTAPFAHTAVGAGRPVTERLRQHGAPADGQHPFPAVSAQEALPHVPLGDRHRHAGLEPAVRQLRQPLRVPAHSDAAFHVVVPGRDVGIADGPVDAVAVARIRLEVEVAPAIHLATPDDGAPSHLTTTDIGEARTLRRGVGVFTVAHEELVAPLVAGVAGPLHRLLALERGAVPQAAEPDFPRLHVHGVVGGRRDRAAGLEHERAKPPLGQLLRGPAPADARADHDGVVAHRHVSAPRAAWGAGRRPRSGRA